MKDDSAEILFQSFLKEALVISSGMSGGGGYPLFDVVYPAFLRPSTVSPTLQSALKGGFREAVVACDVPKHAPQMILQLVFLIFPVLHCPLGLAELQACPFPDVVFPPLPLSALWHLSRDGNLHGSDMSHAMTASPKPSFRHLRGWATLGRQRKCLIDNIKEWTSLPMPVTAHNGLQQNRPEKGSLLFRPSRPPEDPIGQETELN